MYELHETGSISPGQSIATMYGMLARPEELMVTPEVTEGWRRVNHLIQHIDSRIDGDYPNSGKPSSEGQDQAPDIGNYLNYLAFPTMYPALPDDTLFTDEQKEAFVGVREYFDQSGLNSLSRQAFTASLRLWVAYSLKAKQATSVADYIKYRRLDGQELGQLFALTVPDSARKDHWRAFAWRSNRLGGLAKLADSTLDFRKDRKNRNLHEQLSNRAWLGVTAVAAYRGAKFALTHPRLAKPLLGKLSAYRKNRSGSRNPDRVLH